MKNLIIIILILATPLAYAADNKNKITEYKEIMALPLKYLGLVTVVGESVDGEYTEMNTILMRTKESYLVFGNERIDYDRISSYMQNGNLWHIMSLRDKSIRVRMTTKNGIKLMQIVNKKDGVIKSTYVVVVEWVLIPKMHPLATKR